jgi:Tfp pilus assembly protein PilX
MWWIAIGMGFVVVLVVIVLLSLLISLVTDIDGNVKRLWAMATRVARNTATTWMLQQTASAAAALADETARHADALTSLAAAAAPARSAPSAPSAPFSSPETGSVGTQTRPRRKY